VSAFDSGTMKLDATAIQLRAFNIRIASCERMIEVASRIAAQTPKEGKQGEIGPRGPQGPQGPEGPPGPAPEHRWQGTALQFMQPSGEWGKAVDLQGPKGDTASLSGLDVNGFAKVVAQDINSWTPQGW
jgi:hypothetical protein